MVLELKPEVLEKVEKSDESEEVGAEESVTDLVNGSEDDKRLDGEDESIAEAAALKETKAEADVRSWLDVGDAETDDGARLCDELDRIEDCALESKSDEFKGGARLNVLDKTGDAEVDKRLEAEEVDEVAIKTCGDTTTELGLLDLTVDELALPVELT